jgi:hypothetical protein
VLHHGILHVNLVALVDVIELLHRRIRCGLEIRSLGFRFPIRVDYEKPVIRLSGSPVEYLLWLLGVRGL